MTTLFSARPPLAGSLATLGLNLILIGRFQGHLKRPQAMHTNCLKVPFRIHLAAAFQQQNRKVISSLKSIAVVLYRGPQRTNPNYKRDISPQSSTRAVQNRTWTGSNILANSYQVQISTVCAEGRVIIRDLHQEVALQGAGVRVTSGMKFTECLIIHRQETTM